MNINMLSESLSKKLISIIKRNSYLLKPIQTDTDPVLNWSGNIKSIVFDIYGTLLISSSGDIGSNERNLPSRVFTRAMEEAGIQIANSKAGEKGITLYYSEIKRTHSDKKQNGIINPEVEITEVWKKVFYHMKEQNLIENKTSESKILSAAVWFECLTNPVWPMPQSLLLLKTLKEKKIPLGIISNAQFYTPLIFPALTGSTLEELGFNSDLIEFSYIKGIAKPSVNMFASVCSSMKRHYHIKAEEILYVGNDMLNDIYSAKISGMTTALFAGDARSLRMREEVPEVINIKPDLIINELDQILGII